MEKLIFVLTVILLSASAHAGNGEVGSVGDSRVQILKQQLKPMTGIYHSAPGSEEPCQVETFTVDLFDRSLGSTSNYGLTSSADGYLLDQGRTICTTSVTGEVYCTLSTVRADGDRIQFWSHLCTVSPYNFLKRKCKPSISEANPPGMEINLKEGTVTTFRAAISWWDAEASKWDTQPALTCKYIR